MSAIPFGFIGAIAGHLIMGFELSIISMMGIVALTGVVVNDNLVLIDRINQLRAAGHGLREALLQAARDGHAVTDEASAMEAAGHPVQLVAGSSSNLKVTVPEDLALAQFYLQQATSGGMQ